MAESTPPNYGSEGVSGPPQFGSEGSSIPAPPQGSPSAPSPQGSLSPPPPPAVAPPADVAYDDWSEAPSIAAPIFIASIASALLGALLALAILAWINGGLEYEDAGPNAGDVRSGLAGSGGEDGSSGGEQQSSSGGGSEQSGGGGGSKQSGGGGGSNAPAGAVEPTHEPAMEEMPTEVHEPTRTPKPTATRRPTSTPRSR